jgi:mycothiol system anti-sigma-R factor
MSTDDIHGHAETQECREALHELYQFVDGELTDDTRAQIQEHLEGCPPCYEAFDFEAELKAHIANRCRERVPDELRDRIADAIAQREPR